MSTAAKGRSPSEAAARAVRLTIIGLLICLVAACSSASPAPLRLSEGQEGISSCMPNSPADGLGNWAAPVAYAEDMYWNQGSAPLTVESVSLLDPHNLILHGSLVYEMVHGRHPLPISWAWAGVGSKVPPSEWRARQPIPGAVIPPTVGPVEQHGSLSSKVNLYEIVLDISAATPVGGWALGEVVTYKASGVSHVFTAKTGLGIGTSRLPAVDSCNAQMTAIAAGFGRSTPP